MSEANKKTDSAAAVAVVKWWCYVLKIIGVDLNYGVWVSANHGFGTGTHYYYARPGLRANDCCRFALCFGECVEKVAHTHTHIHERHRVQISVAAIRICVLFNWAAFKSRLKTYLIRYKLEYTYAWARACAQAHSNIYIIFCNPIFDSVVHCSVITLRRI